MHIKKCSSRCFTTCKDKNINELKSTYPTYPLSRVIKHFQFPYAHHTPL